MYHKILSEKAKNKTNNKKKTNYKKYIFHIFENSTLCKLYMQFKFKQKKKNSLSPSLSVSLPLSFTHTHTLYISFSLYLYFYLFLFSSQFQKKKKIIFSRTTNVNVFFFYNLKRKEQSFALWISEHCSYCIKNKKKKERKKNECENQIHAIFIPTYFTLFFLYQNLQFIESILLTNYSNELLFFLESNGT